MDQSRIRNFSIIAHIDHGKSTLADRLLERTGAIAERDMRDQLLDDMDLERERGITIKANAVRIDYDAKNGERYELNLIDTPGHVDFSYEVSRSLEACEGALLIVDAAQGVEAQTLANAHLAIESGLEIIPIVNKIDLPAADPDRAARELANILGGSTDEVVRISAKSGSGIDDLLEIIVDRLPTPIGDPDAPLRALVFDSYYDTYRGVVALIRVVDGSLTEGDRIRLMASGQDLDASEVGVRRPAIERTGRLVAGEVGYLITGVKDIDLIRVGDTVTQAGNAASEPLEGYAEPKSMVFSGLFPTDGDDFERLREALDKLRLNDSSLRYTAETSRALGFGFRVGFLGLLHMDIVRERLEREYDLDLVATAPSVEYRAILLDGSEQIVQSPQDLPSPGALVTIEEPYMKVMIITPSEYIGAVMELVQTKRGEMGEMNYLSPERVELHYLMPLAEIVFDFFDTLKSRTRGYASLDYEPDEYRPADLVRVDILLNAVSVDAFSTIVHKDRAYNYGKAMVHKLRELIPRQQFDVPIQAAIGSRIIARETVKAKRKDVTAKCYGGDITRKRKLLERQKEGKKRMKMVGSVEVPQEAFIAALKIDQD
ncbi:MAG: translation elongation factor 4 [Actinomycetota bacterium]|nr:translation elongation factor 4 [Actinomycetota bacterium]MDK1016393.1 translation elongation factor 4 [Actinomycetota bacterium]MDK1038109.1 translation elongation factor 4 [Actinomycetota bacterium]MDK1103770.1 translation elongation factor 4 [Actinomycetota bacterium]MDK1291913.1 translation elongation factor 4 [Actinomycetota bacterium]